MFSVHSEKLLTIVFVSAVFLAAMNYLSESIIIKKLSLFSSQFGGLKSIGGAKSDEGSREDGRAHTEKAATSPGRKPERLCGGKAQSYTTL